MDKDRLQHKIQQLRTRYLSPDSKTEISNLETEISRLLDEKNVLASPQFKKFADLAQKNLDDLNALLMNDDELLNEKGKLLSHQRRIWREFLAAFALSPRDKALEYLESSIDQKL